MANQSYDDFYDSMYKLVNNPDRCLTGWME